MEQGYFLDTNTVIYYLEGVLTPAGKALVQEAVAEGSKISFISKIELLGWNPPEGSKIYAIQTFLHSASIVGLDDVITDLTIYLRKTYRKIKLPDAIIAATCIGCGMKLTTRNTADFSPIKELTIINPFER